MEKRSRTEHQSGCIKGLINIFDFRHGRLSQKLLADEKNGSRQITGHAASTSLDLDTLNDSCEMCRITKAGDQSEAAIRDRMSVKELMQEEMLKQDHTRQSISNQHGHRRKNRWGLNRKSFDLSDLNVISWNSTHQRHKSLSSLEVGEMMTELCTEINLKDADCLLRPEEDPLVTEEKLEEATKVFVSHFVNRKNIEDVNWKPSRELVDALQILNSNKDVFLRLLRDPSSRLYNLTQNLVDHQDKNSKVRVRHAEIEQDDGKSKLQGFFWRKFKGIERGLLKKHDEHSHNGSTIVILKPGSQSSDKKNQTERVSTHFLLAEITRKLKHVMRKEQGGTSTNPEKAFLGDGVTMASPTRDHFFIEKIPRKSISAKNRDKDALKDEERSTVISLRYLLSRNETETSVQEEISQSELGKNSPIVDDIEIMKSDADKIHLEGYTDIVRLSDADLDKGTSVGISSEPCSPSTSTNELANENSTENKEDQDAPLNMVTVIENEASPPLTSSSGTKNAEASDAVTDRSDWTSPISVLEPIFSEDDVSPMIKSMPDGELIQPRKISFENHISPSAPKTWEEERNSILECVKNILQVSLLSRDQLLERFHLGEYLLDPSLLDELDIFIGSQYYDPKLIFDLIEEVLSEVCEQCFDGISSFFKSYMSDMKGKEIVDEILKRVNRHLEYASTQSTWDHAVSKDVSHSTWMELRYDCESIGIEVEEEIFDELIEDTIFSCIMNQVK